ncbi:MAG: regulatory iron-sulfur-containing complex subunit RicT [Acidobacteriota bacterium]|nr:regulatory iron-sulfur-containing complex subunit RicT [Acidobacteriota bacterium]
MSCQGCSYTGISTAIEHNFVGVRFREETNLTLCESGEEIYSQGETVVVELDSGPAVGRIERSPMPIFKPCQKSNSGRILRRAGEKDRELHERQLTREMSAKRFAQERVHSLSLEMKVSKVQFSLDGSLARFFFTADGRIDFRELVRDLSGRFSVKVRMVQVGTRDEAGLIGGVGVCGRTLCCSTWLKDFRPISIQMAKRQGLSLNPSKISGQCGRLLCCLAYEDDQYQKPKAKQSPTRAN